MSNGFLRPGFFSSEKTSPTSSNPVPCTSPCGKTRTSRAIGSRVTARRGNRSPGTTYVLSLIHISEPTRLGMISYAVFCLKKKKKQNRLKHKLQKETKRKKNKTHNKKQK